MFLGSSVNVVKTDRKFYLRSLAGEGTAGSKDSHNGVSMDRHFHSACYRVAVVSLGKALNCNGS